MLSVPLSIPFACALVILWNTLNVFYGCNVLSHKKIYAFQIPKLHRWACSANVINLCISHICHIYVDCICGLRRFSELSIDVSVFHMYTNRIYAISCWLASYFVEVTRSLRHLVCMPTPLQMMNNKTDGQTTFTLHGVVWIHRWQLNLRKCIQTHQHLTKLCAIALFLLNNFTPLTRMNGKTVKAEKINKRNNKKMRWKIWNHWSGRAHACAPHLLLFLQFLHFRFYLLYVRLFISYVTTVDVLL